MKDIHENGHTTWECLERDFDKLVRPAYVTFAIIGNIAVIALSWLWCAYLGVV